MATQIFVLFAIVAVAFAAPDVSIYGPSGTIKSHDYSTPVYGRGYDYFGHYPTGIVEIPPVEAKAIPVPIEYAHPYAYGYEAKSIPASIEHPLTYAYGYDGAAYPYYNSFAAGSYPYYSPYAYSSIAPHYNNYYGHYYY